MSIRYIGSVAHVGVNGNSLFYNTERRAASLERAEIGDTDEGRGARFRGHRLHAHDTSAGRPLSSSKELQELQLSNKSKLKPISEKC